MNQIMKEEDVAWTVLLLYPDYLSDGAETYQAHVWGADVDEAIYNAQLEVSRPRRDPDPDDPEEDYNGEPEDYLPLAAYRFHLVDQVVKSKIYSPYA